MKRGVAIIPGADPKVLQKASGKEFSNKNANRIKAAPDSGGNGCKSVIKRGDHCSAAVNRKHQKRGLPHHGELTVQKRVKACPEHFQTPAQRAAEQKISFHIQQSFPVFLHKFNFFIACPGLEKTIRRCYTYCKSSGNRSGTLLFARDTALWTAAVLSGRNTDDRFAGMQKTDR